ncbi:DUF2179 domain-containing protein [Brevibacillus massiliensis]|uniref:DUF2179 domain-containing protein n=2 Tax=Brevibacillus massiliensis TaxID=1118054 RepID=UPI0002EB4196|nr:DUF5698 domain-containing protein [Brevibacillus massiliensis]
MVYVLMGLIQITYVSLNSFRVVLMIKGRKLLAAMIGTIEILVYIYGLALVLNNLESFWGIIIYSASYGIGILLGTYIEQKIALGYIGLQIITDNELELEQKLRDRGYGVTTWMGQGASGYRKVYLVIAKRKEYADLLSSIKQTDAKAFIISYDITHSVGGFWRGRINRA